MSELSGFSCDYCHKKIGSEDYGIWIRANRASDEIVVGRTGVGGEVFDRLDFCSTEHMVKFLDEKIRQR